MALHDEIVRTSLPALLRYQDRNSMAFSVESRVPFLTRSMAELALSLPEAFLIDPTGISKAVLRRAMRGIVPDAVLDRKDKIAFETPERAWLETLRPWIETTLDGAVARSIPALVRRKDRINGTATWRRVNLVRWAELFDVHFDD